MKIILSFLAICIVLINNNLRAQHDRPEDWGLRAFEINDKQCGLIRFYVDTTAIDRKAPILLDVNGSGHFPNILCIQTDSAMEVMSTFLSPLMDRTAADYHYVLLDKPDVPFVDTVAIQSADIYEAFSHYPPSNGYTEKLSLYWRANAYKAVVRYLQKKGFHDGGAIVAFGSSEGGQVAPYLAANCPSITHVVSLMGGGLNQFFDEMTAWRLRAHKGECSHAEAQSRIDTLFQQYQDIYAHPTATDRRYWGHSYLRWASFCAQDPLESLVKLDIPIFMVAGTADSNSPIFGLDYVPLEFLRRGKTNLTYRVCVGCDHSLQVVADQDENSKPTSLFMPFVEEALAWCRDGRRSQVSGRKKRT